MERDCLGARAFTGNSPSDVISPGLALEPLDISLFLLAFFKMPGPRIPDIGPLGDSGPTLSIERDGGRGNAVGLSRKHRDRLSPRASDSGEAAPGGHGPFYA
ncbi:hypothetical protein GCM10007897_17700 [Sphingobium jiangsuense]|nr:hypothetical protein GCM10007897_17700 [Sphingobium jiangsuense]